MTIALTRRHFLASSGGTLMGGIALASGIGGVASVLAGPAARAAAAGVVGQPAAPFAVTDIKGAPVGLDALKGRVVVLEWTNHGCPFVRKHYDSGNMQALQKEFKGKGVTWLTIVSSAEGQQGHLTAAAAAARMVEEGFASTHKILDPSGALGRAYDAKVTPHMYIIGTDGTLLYNGAIDSIRSTRKEDVATAEPWFRTALTAALAGQPIANATNPAYGCTIKYAKGAA